MRLGNTHAQQTANKGDLVVMTAAHSIRVLRDDGDFSPATRVSWVDGRFSFGGESQQDDLDGSGLWLIPGLVDAHLHAAWQEFDAEDQERVDPETAQAETAESLARTLAAGITSARDAGGLSAAALARVPANSRPRVQLSVALIDRAAADAAGGTSAAVEGALAAGARWIKLVGTAGVVASSEAGLETAFVRADIKDAVQRAERVGAGVMLHAWGGQAIDDAIDAGVMSIEHGIYLTAEQAHRAAEHGMTLVPTLRIYWLVQRMIADGILPASFEPRVNDAVASHPLAVRRARDAGLPIALGSDYGTTKQHGTNRLEFDALVAAGLSPQEALISATRSGAALLARVAQDPESAPDGRIAEGSVADAVLLRSDPRGPGALSDPEAIIGILKGGAIVHCPRI